MIGTKYNITRRQQKKMIFPTTLRCMTLNSCIHSTDYTQNRSLEI